MKKVFNNSLLEHFLTVKCQVYLRFGLYNKILDLPRPKSYYLLWSAIDSFVNLGTYTDWHRDLIVGITLSI